MLLYPVPEMDAITFLSFSSEAGMETRPQAPESQTGNSSNEGRHNKSGAPPSPQLSLNPRDRRESDSLLYYLVSLFVCFCLKCVVQRKQGWLRNFGLIVKKAFGEVKVGKGSVHEYRQSQDYCPRPFVFFPSLSLFFLFCFIIVCVSPRLI